MWFKAPKVSRQLFYPLRLTVHRNNVQLLISQLDWRAKAGDFFCVIYDGRGDAFFVPFSWLQARVLSRKPRIRTRPQKPSQRYYTVYPIRNSHTTFSFGPDRNGKTIEIDLGRFRNTVGSEKKGRLILEATGIRNWEDRLGGTVTFHTKDLAGPVRKDLPPIRTPVRNEGLAGKGGVIFVTEKGMVLAVQKERGGDPSRVVKIYEEMLRTGKVSGELAKKVGVSRPFQRALRLVALDIYDHKCAMCDVDVPSQLVTSHIVPVGRSAELIRTLPSNIILLCRLHDGLFEQGLITVSPSYRIVCGPKLKTKSKLLQKWALGLNGQRLSKPSRHLPQKSFLKQHARRAGTIV